jgi:WD40 repeat protein
MGGTGKTALSVKLLEQISDRFEAFMWRSLRNAPPLQRLLSDLILFLSGQQAILPDFLESQLSMLMELLRQRRCLLVLDNAESILQGSERVGQYREGYEAYRELFARVANGRHQSSLVLTSRERPIGLTAQLGDQTAVRSLSLTGLPLSESQQILTAKGLIDADSAFQQLVQAYSGNPLALKIAAATIHSTFSGNISQFLQQQIVAYGDIWDLLDQQFDRLSRLEQQVMYWLAIEREWIAFADLHENFIPPIPQRQLVEALESLQGRSLIETSAMGFTQQPVVMEYVTQMLIEHCYREITTQTLDLCRSQALLKTQTQDHIRETQVRLILQPLGQKLLGAGHGKATVEFLLEQLLDTLRGKPLAYTGYAAGNVINLLSVLPSELSDRDFSDLAIAQAYLAEATLHRTNFTGSTLYQSMFVETLGGIVSVAFSPDGQMLAASDNRGEIHILNICSGQKLMTLSGHHSWVFSLVFSPNSITLASASDDFVVKLWEITTGDCLQTLRGPSNLLNIVTFNPDERRIISDDKNAAIQLWNADSPESQIAMLQGFAYLARATAFSPDRQTIAVSASDQTIKLWNLQTGNCEITLKPHSLVIMLTFSGDGQHLASTSLNPAIQIWDLATHQCVQTLEGHTQNVSQMDFSPDNRYLVSSSFDQTVRIWEVTTGRCLKTLYGHGKKLMAVAFSPDGTRIASSGDDHAVKLWNLHTGQCTKTFQGYTNVIPAIALSPNQSTLVSGHEDKTVRLWDLQSDQLIQTISAHSDIVWGVAFAPSGECFASVSADRTVKLWNVRKGICWIGSDHINWVWTVAFHPAGHMLATGSYDRTIRLWDVQTGQCLNTWTGHTDPVLSVCFSLDGHSLVSSSFDQTIRVWNVETGTCVKILRGHRDRIWQAAFSTDGQTLASCSHDETVKLWDIHTGKCFKTLTGHQGAVATVYFRPNSQTFVSGGFDRTIKIWDAYTGEILQTLQGHRGGVLSALWRSVVTDDTTHSTPQIISSSLDGTIKIWNLETGTCLKTLRAPRPYEGMDITRLSGLTAAQQNTLRELGAIGEGFTDFP